LSRSPPARRCRPGGWEGKVFVADDFDEPLPADILEAFEGQDWLLADQLLLGTHAFIWWRENSPRLRADVRGLSTQRCRRCWILGVLVPVGVIAEGKWLVAHQHALARNVVDLEPNAVRILEDEE
jgi:hypothetical protein